MNVCKKCESSIDLDVRFCTNCGNRVKVIDYDGDQLFKSKLNGILIFYLLQLLICLTAAYTDYFDYYPVRIFLDVALFIVTLVFFVQNFKYITPLLSVKKLKLKLILTIVPIAIFASVGVSYLVDLVNEKLFHVSLSYTKSFIFLDNKLFWMLLADALFPAIDEEIGFRGVFYGQLKSFLKPKQIVWVTTILFATIHLSAISALWIVPFGFIAADLRRKYNTLWYGIIIHFFFNATAVVIDYFYYVNYFSASE